MFERFTAQSRTVVVDAQAQARGLGHNYLGTEHLLLAMLHSDGIAATVLHAAGVEHAAVRGAIVRLVRSPGQLSHDETEALKTIGIDVDEVLSGIQAQLGASAPVQPGDSAKRRFFRRDPHHIPFTARARKSLEGGLREAQEAKDQVIGTEHLLLGLLRDSDCLAVRILREQGLDLADLRQRTLEAHRQAA